MGCCCLGFALVFGVVVMVYTHRFSVCEFGFGGVVGCLVCLC